MGGHSLLDDYFRPPTDHVVRLLRAARALAHEGAGHERAVLAAPVVHPLLAPPLAACLGVTEDELWALAYFEAFAEDRRIVRLPRLDDPAAPLHDADEAPEPEVLASSGPEAIGRLLVDCPLERWPAGLGEEGFTPADLLLRVVPVRPPEATPLVLVDGGARMPGAEAYHRVALAAQSRRLRALVESGAPVVLIASMHREMQTTFEALCMHSANADGASGPVRCHRTGCHFDLSDRYLHPDVPPRAGLLGAPDPSMIDDIVEELPIRPLGCAFAGSDRLVLSFLGAHLIVNRADGAVVGRSSVPAARLLTVDAAGRRGSFLWCGSLRVLDFESGEWLEELPEEPCPDHLLESEERAFLLRLGRGICAELFELTDHPVRYAVSPDNHFAWIEDRAGNGGVYKMSTGLLQLAGSAVSRAGEGVPLLDPERGLTPPGEASGDDTDETAERAGGYRADRAFVLDGEGRWRVLAGRTFHRGGRPIFQLGIPVHAAAFDRSGEELLVASAEEVWIIRTSEPRVVARYRLDQSALAPLVDPSAASPPDGAARSRLPVI